LFLSKREMFIMEAIEIETTIATDGTMKLPSQFVRAYGRKAKIIVLLKDEVRPPVDLMKHSGSIDWPVDGITYQRELRDEWD